MRKKLLLVLSAILFFILESFSSIILDHVSDFENNDVKKDYKSRLVHDKIYSVKKLHELNLVPKIQRHNLIKYQNSEYKDFYAYLLYDEVIYERLLCTFNIGDLYTINPIYDIECEYYPDIVSGAYGNDLYYYYGCDQDGYAAYFASIDIETKKTVIINDYNINDYVIVNDMTYDYSNSTMYVSINNDLESNTILSKVNLKTGNFENIVELDNIYLTLASTYEGKLFAISIDGDLFEIDKETGKAELVLSTGLYPAYTQSMEFDRMDGILYWAYFDDSFVGSMVRINIEDKSVENLGEIGEYAQISGLYIPFIEGNVDAPNFPLDFKVIPKCNGCNDVVLSWINPETTLGGSTIEEISEVRIYRNGDLLTTLNDNVLPGNNMSFEDINVPLGMNIYEVSAFNSNGEGVKSKFEIFIGEDTPGQVKNLRFTSPSVNTAELSWEAPEIGANGGWFDSSSLYYRVTRYPDSIIVADNLESNSFVDNDLDKLQFYSYEIHPVNESGDGKIAVTDTILIGSSIYLPYYTSFSERDVALWTLIDGNGDDNSWSFNKMIGQYWFDGDDSDAAFYFGDEKNEIDEWLISSPIRLVGSESYELSFTNRVSRKGEEVIMEITIGKDSNPDSHEVLFVNRLTDFNEKDFILAMPKIEDGIYNIGIHLISSINSYLQVKDLSIVESDNSRIYGCITDGERPVLGANVNIIKDSEVVYSATTDSDGMYYVNSIGNGNYIIDISCNSYESIQSNIVIENADIYNRDFELGKANYFKLSGSVVDEIANPLSQVSVTINSENGDKINVSTDSDGTFSVDKIAYGSYEVQYFKNSYVQYNSDIVINSDLVLDQIIMQRKVLPPSDIKFEDGLVKWNEPVEYKIYRYDNGNPESDSFGFNGGNMRSVLGTIFKQHLKLTSVSWFTLDDGYDDHNLVNLFVFDVNPDGTPTNRILFQQEDIVNNPGEWCAFTLPEPLECPNGCLVALSVNSGYLSLGMDNGLDEDYLFRERTYCSTDDFENHDFYFLEERDNFRNNFMIRAEGIPVSASYAETEIIQGESLKARSNYGKQLSKRHSIKPVDKNIEDFTEEIYPQYDIYRMKAGDEDDINLWVKLSDNPVNSFEYNDSEWGSLDNGYYKYAVNAIYLSGSSDFIISDSIGKGVLTKLELEISTNVESYIIDGEVSAKLFNDHNSYVIRNDKDNVILFDNILKGEYQLVIDYRGCEKYEDILDLSAEDTYEKQIVLNERIVSPSPVNIIEQENNSYMLTWNEIDIYDDFEAHNDFTINSSGEAGWNYIDGDSSQTAGFLNSETSSWYEFENMFKPMAFIVFNPSATEPSIQEKEFSAYSGSKYLGALSSELQNDDYFISRELNGAVDFHFSFFANSMKSLDYMSVGYSYTDKNKEDFIWIDENISVSEGWNKYDYDVPAGVRYVAIRCESYRGLILMLDDVSLKTTLDSRPDKEGIGSHYYEIYLDGELINTQDSISFIFDDLSIGKHTAGVKAVYASGESEIQNVEFTVMSSGISMLSDDIDIYPNPVSDILYINGDYSYAEIYDLSGFMLRRSDRTYGSLDVSDLSSGTYIVKLYKDENAIIRKFTKK